MRILNPEAVRQIFREYLREAGCKENTVRTRMEYAKVFLSFLDPEADLRETGLESIDEFIDHLNLLRSNKTGRPLARITKKAIAATMKMIFRCLYQKDLLLSNPVQALDWKPSGEEKRRAVFTEEEMRLVLEGIEENKEYGLRDRTLFELLYSSGLRVSEAAKLLVGDIDFQERMLLIREGKWSRDRMVPVNRVAMVFLERLLAGREEEKEARVFGSIGPGAINRRLKKHLAKVGLDGRGFSAHSIRHATAVHLLAHGADLRYVQELLGHQSLQTTVIYTHEMQENLRRVYRQFHPRENGCFREIDEEYMRRIANLSRALTDKKRLANLERWRKKKKQL